MKKLLFLFLFLSAGKIYAQQNFHQILVSTTKVKGNSALVFVQYNDNYFITENVSGNDENNFEVKPLGGKTMGGVTETTFAVFVNKKILKGYKFLLSQGQLNGKAINTISAYSISGGNDVPIEDKYKLRTYNLSLVR